MLPAQACGELFGGVQHGGVQLVCSWCAAGPVIDSNRAGGGSMTQLHVAAAALVLAWVVQHTV